MYFKKNWGSMAEKGPPLGRIDIFQTSPSVSHTGIACDEREGYLDMDTILIKIWNNEINSRITARSIMISFKSQERSCC